MESLASFICGVLLWTFLEYLVHGWLGHVCRTFVSALHRQHHQDERAVFAIRAWLPLALLWTGAALWWRWSPGVVLFTGALAGFVWYEAVHYRIHFCAPQSATAQYLRNRHLAHHLRSPQALFGVTSPLWDRIFGTEPPRDWAMMEGVAAVRPLSGRSNLHMLWRLDYLRRPLSPRGS